jgi:hypothetical protein
MESSARIFTALGTVDLRVARLSPQARALGRQWTGDPAAVLSAEDRGDATRAHPHEASTRWPRSDIRKPDTLVGVLDDVLGGDVEVTGYFFYDGVAESEAWGRALVQPRVVVPAEGTGLYAHLSLQTAAVFQPMARGLIPRY